MKRDARGFTLPAAVFLVAVLSVLSAWLVGLAGQQQAAFILDTLGTRAYAAAKAGAEWGAYNSLRNNACAASTTIGLAGTLAPYTVKVTCVSSGPYNEAGASVIVDTIVATACNSAACPDAAPGPTYVERQVSFTVAR
jgi:MSHA biogenesis protein MshP